MAFKKKNLIAWATEAHEALIPHDIKKVVGNK
jgi:hypothetical protein